MAEKDQTLEETLTDDKPKETSEEKAGKETPKEPKKEPKETTEPTVDYKAKFVESQREGIKLAKKVKELEEVPKSKEPVETIESKTGETLDEIVEKKVQEKIAPLTKVQKEKEEQIVESFFKDRPDTMDHIKEIEELYPTMPGKTTEQKLENAHLLVKKDAMKEAGKKEMAFNLYQKEQVVASGGGDSSSTGESLPTLSEEEKQVAQALGLNEEAYAKRRLESKPKK